MKSQLTTRNFLPVKITIYMEMMGTYPVADIQSWKSDIETWPVAGMGGITQEAWPTMVLSPS